MVTLAIAKAAARFTVTVLFPTPPLPLMMAILCLILRHPVSLGSAVVQIPVFGKLQFEPCFSL
jgi:hypothetical protein